MIAPRATVATVDATGRTRGARRMLTGSRKNTDTPVGQIV